MLKVLPLSGCRAVELKDKEAVVREPAVGSEGRLLGAKLAPGLVKDRAEPLTEAGT